MSHIRQQIRDEIYSLVSGLSTTGVNAFKSRVYPLQSADLPGLCVFTGEEEIDDEEGKVEGIQHRAIHVVVCGYDKIIAGLDDNLDNIAEEVEKAVLVGRFLGGLSTGIDLVSTETGIDAELEKPTGEISMIFRINCLTEEGRPETAL